MRAIALLPILLALSAGCLNPAPGNPTGLESLDPTDWAPVLLSAPVLLTADTHGGFEPSIEVGPDGTIYVTAATSRRPGELATSSARLASWLWYSRDNGTTWNDLPSPAQAHQWMLGLEGDITVDAAGRLYFVDTYLADNTISRWSQSPTGPAWDFSRPIQGTASPLDDRPWLTAQGDGIVYLLGNNGAALPAPESIMTGDSEPGSKWLHRSEDGGLTWSLGRAFDDWCVPAADPSNDMDLIVVCIDGPNLRVHESLDRGRIWTNPFTAAYEHGPSLLIPGAAIDRDGTRHAAWIDDDATFEGVQDFVWHGTTPGQIRVAHAAHDGAWSEPQDITPFAGRFGLLHSAAGSGGVHAVAFYASTDLEVKETTEWTPHLLLSLDADSPAPTYRHVPLLEAPAGKGTTPPRDFFQIAVGPDDTVHAILQKDRTNANPQPGDGIRADLLYRRTVASL